MTNPKVLCFGEVLWDVFPDKKVLGGAPLNVALRLTSFGISTSLLSCVGDDEIGRAALDIIHESGLNTSLIQKTKELATGQVLIALDKKGNATYDIQLPVAWDAIVFSESIKEILSSLKVFVFGSLAARSPFNRATLQQLLQLPSIKVFDVNLRAPHYDLDMVYELMQLADVVKLNDDELAEVVDTFSGPKVGMKEQVSWLSKISRTDTICVTRGGEGALLLFEGEFYEHSGFTVDVVDTVGAGDSFLATLIDYLLLQKEKPMLALSSACAIGALIASKPGANSALSVQEIASLLKTTS